MSEQLEHLFIPRLTLIGVGLIGGSLVQALRSQNAVGQVVGVGRSQANLELALELGTVDEISTNTRTAVQGADVVVLATPVLTIDKVLEEIAPCLNSNTIVTDVGSVKGVIVDQAKARLGKLFPRFVAAHPIAGSENSGVQAAYASLFNEHRVIITPSPETDADALDTITKMWALTGAEVENMSIQRHDEVLSVTSHLPHVLAYALMRFLNEKADKEAYFRLAAGGLYDFTRIASSDPTMWRDICVSNKEQVSCQLRAFSADLNEFAEHIEGEKMDVLQEDFSAAKAARARVASFRKYSK